MIPSHPAHQPPPPKFCKDCNHCAPHPTIGDAVTVCGLAEPRYNLVDGERDYATAWCEFQRNSGPCGEHARFFEHKEAA